MCYLVYGMAHIQEPLLLMERVAHVAPAFLSRYLSGSLGSSSSGGGSSNSGGSSSSNSASSIVIVVVVVVVHNKE